MKKIKKIIIKIRCMFCCCNLKKEDIKENIKEVKITIL